MYREPCSALKLIEFHIHQRVLEVYHQGEHTCQVKPDQKENDKEIEETVKKYGPNVTPKQMAQMKMTEELKKQFNSGVLDMDKIIDIGSVSTNRDRINQIKVRMQTQMRSEKHSLSAVAELKGCTDTYDKYLISKIHRVFVNTHLLVHKHVKISVDEWISETTCLQKHVKFLEKVQRGTALSVINAIKRSTETVMEFNTFLSKLVTIKTLQ